MTDTQPIQEGSEDLDRGQPAAGEDSLQEQAGRENGEPREPDDDRARPPGTPPIANPD